MMNILKFLLLYIYKLIIINPWKFSLGLLSLILFHYAGTSPDTKVVIPVLDSLHINNQYQYIYLDYTKNNGIYKIYNSDNPIKLEDGKIIDYKYNDINIILWILFGLSIIPIIAILIISVHDSDAQFDFDEIFQYALSWFVNCDLDDKSYCFHVFGKLIYKVNSSNGVHKLHDYDLPKSIRELRMLVSYQNKNERRDKLIGNLLQ